jgi:hypothetical protein
MQAAILPDRRIYYLIGFYRETIGIFLADVGHAEFL